MELDGEVGAGGVELLGTAAANVLPQDAGRELVPIVDGEDVAVGDVQAERRAWLESSVSREPRQDTAVRGSRGSQVTSPGVTSLGVTSLRVTSLRVTFPGGFEAGRCRRFPGPRTRIAGPGAATRAQWRPVDGGDSRGHRAGMAAASVHPGNAAALEAKGMGSLAALPLLQGRGQGMDAHAWGHTALMSGGFSGCPGLAGWVEDHTDPKGGQ